MDRFLKEISEDTSMQWKEMNKIAQDMKVEVESIKKTQPEGNLEIKIEELEQGLLRQTYEQNTRGGRVNLRHWRHNKRNGCLDKKKMLNLPTSAERLM